jgi:ankyrin repeat protein
LGVEECTDSDDDDEEGGPKSINLTTKVLEGSFLPAMILLHLKKINVEDIIDPNQGLKLLHYSCYFGRIKALKALTEIFKADINTIDYRGQTPLHVSSVSGELGATIYMCSKGPLCFKDTKDNALMTPLMNTVSRNHEPSFIYFYFKENCELRNVDING